MWEDHGPSLHEDPSVSQTVGSIYSVHVINGTSAVNNGREPQEDAGTEDSGCEEVSKGWTKGCEQQRGIPAASSGARRDLQSMFGSPQAHTSCCEPFLPWK